MSAAQGQDTGTNTDPEQFDTPPRPMLLSFSRNQNEARTSNNSLQRISIQMLLDILSRNSENTSQLSSEQRRRGILQQILNSIQNQQTRNRRGNLWDNYSSSSDDSDDDDESRHMQRRQNIHEIIRRHYGSGNFDEIRRRRISIETSTQTRQRESLREYLNALNSISRRLFVGEEEEEYDILDDDEQSLDPEEYEYVRTYIVHGGFGTTGLETYKRLLRAGIVNHRTMRLSRLIQDDDDKDEDFLVKILRHFIRLERANGDLDTFMSCMPTLERLQQLCETEHVQTNRTKELVLKKLMIDIWENYLRSNEAPLFHDLINKLLPLAIQFFQNLSPTMVLYIVAESERVSDELGVEDRFEFITYQSSTEYVAHYSKAYRELQNAVLCQNMHDYLI